MNSIQTYIDAYISDMEGVWSDTTCRSERYRLYAVKGVLEPIHSSSNPLLLWNSLHSRKPYTRVTIWTRVTQFYNWLLRNKHVEGENPYVEFRQRNKKLFTGAYSRSTSPISFTDAIKKIRNIGDSDCERTAYWLLKNGLRFSEFKTLEGNFVVGKGGRRREIYKSDLPRPGRIPSYSQFRRELKKVGLKPHDLRKIRLTDLVNKGINEFELCAIAGWSNINTASSYIHVNQNRLRELINGE